MITINIAILEDNPVDSLHVNLMISDALSKKYKYNIIGCFEVLDQLLAFLDINPVDLVLSDIFADQRPMGLLLLKQLQHSNLPVVLMTNSQDKSIYTTAQEYKHVNYIIKPFHGITLQSIIDSTFDEYLRSKQYDFFDKKFIYLSGRSGQREQIMFEDIYYLESDLNDCFVHTATRKYVLKKSLSKMLNEKLDERFIRVHQKYAANKKYIKAINDTSLQLANDVLLPIGKSFKKPINDYLKDVL